MSKKTVYLAGGMSGLTYNEATIWRQYAKLRLEAAGYRVLDPTEGKDLDYSGENIDRYTPEQIVGGDMKMISESDIVLAEVSRTDKPYIGTAMEIRQAYIWGKEIVVWGWSKSYWIRYHATMRFGRLDAALYHLESMALSREQAEREKKKEPERSCKTCRHYDGRVCANTPWKWDKCWAKVEKKYWEPKP